MAEAILAAGCLSGLCSLWTPWFWTKHWGSTGFSRCPQLCTCRFDCGWARDTFHEVHALTLERRNRPSKGAARDVGISGDQVLSELGRGGAADVGERGLDIVTEQYRKAKGMLMVSRDGRVVNTASQKELERQRQTAQNVEVKDELREPGVGPDGRPTTSRRTSGQPRPAASRGATGLGTGPPRMPEEQQMIPTTETASTLPPLKVSTERDPGSLAFPPMAHD